MPPNRHSYKNLLYFQSKSFKSLNYRYSTQVCVDATNAEESLYYNYQTFAFNPFVCLLNSPVLAPVFSKVCSSVVHFFPILWLLISSFLIFYKFIFQTVTSHLRGQFRTERQRYNELQLTEFIQFHWNRLNVLKCFMLFWFIKTFAVLLLGPDYFPLFSLFTAHAKFKGLSESFFVSVSSYIPSMLHLIQHPDPSLFIEYGKYPQLLQPTVMETLYVFQVRLLCAILVHGTESWISFIATLIVLGWISARFLTATVYLFDITGSIFQRFETILQDPPGDIDVWNALEDTEGGNQRFHFVAAEMLHGADFFCIIPFVILAIQYDISKLCMIDRAYLFLHGLILTVIMFFYCFEAIIRSKMLDLFDRNSQVGINRFYLLISHVQLISAAFIVSFSTFKAIIYLLGSTDFFQPVQALNASNDFNQAQKLAFEIVFEGRRGLFSATALSARRVKLIMCAIQWSINIASNLLEYSFLLYRSRNSNWAEFDDWVWCVRLITAVTDYIFTVMSFFMILWLSIFDSFGFFRTLILLVYLYFVIYPTAHRGYTWLRWKLFFTIRIMTMRNPSQRELDIEGDNCAICYEVMTPKTGKVTRCGHYFHLECLTLWMKRNPTCPMCHADMLSKNVRNMRLIRYEESIIDVGKASTPATDNTSESSTSATRT
ncbi:hypothetical protein Ciccas_001366 [Cichlidogyrus casuarinus]|uniref:RING-type domain-containing protein n=1 Tax=Cichlidogyrus casuarinus TaxID=1844966 RepID=A0ABD2QK52_9PLAT